MNNKGIIISGGQVSAGQMVVGDHATISVSTVAAPPEQLARDLEEIRRLLEASALQPAQRAVLQEQVKVVEAQGKAAQPDKSLLTSALAMIELAAPAVTGLATIVAGVKGAFGL